MVISHPSTPQHRTAPRNLWPSPAFSDYFSSNDEHESQGSPRLADGAKINPLQHRIFFLLNEIGQQALRADPGDRNAGILEEELGHIVQRLNAPEPQSRIIAELADSGLFIDDDDAEDGIEKGALDEDTEKSARELIEGQEAVARISKVTEQLQQRYQDIHVRRVEHRVFKPTNASRILTTLRFRASNLLQTRSLASALRTSTSTSIYRISTTQCWL